MLLVRLNAQIKGYWY